MQSHRSLLAVFTSLVLALAQIVAGDDLNSVTVRLRFSGSRRMLAQGKQGAISQNSVNLGGIKGGQEAYVGNGGHNTAYGKKRSRQKIKQSANGGQNSIVKVGDISNLQNNYQDVSGVSTTKGNSVKQNAVNIGSIVGGPKAYAANGGNNVGAVYGRGYAKLSQSANGGNGNAAVAGDTSNIQTNYQNASGASNSNKDSTLNQNAANIGGVVGGPKAYAGNGGGNNGVVVSKGQGSGKLQQSANGGNGNVAYAGDTTNSQTNYQSDKGIGKTGSSTSQNAVNVGGIIGGPEAYAGNAGSNQGVVVNKGGGQGALYQSANGGNNNVAYADDTTNVQTNQQSSGGSSANIGGIVGGPKASAGNGGSNIGTLVNSNEAHGTITQSANGGNGNVAYAGSTTNTQSSGTKASFGNGGTNSATITNG